MILTEDEYNEMWLKEFKNKNLSKIPPYHEYLKREVYKQDYLDLFGASKTITYPRSTSGSKYHVSVLGLKIEVDYEYPGEFELVREKQRSIKYVLVGEAPPKPDPTAVKQFYFYNKTHVGSTAYFNAPCSAFGIPSQWSKVDKLVALADNGVLLLDLFPFAINFNKNKNREKVHRYSLTRFEEKIISDLKELVLKIEGLEFLFLSNVGHAEAIISANKHEYNFGETSFNSWGRWTMDSSKEAKRHYPLSNHAGRMSLLDKKHLLTVPIDGFNYLNEYRAMGKDQSGNPHAILIRFGFNLP